MQLFTKLKESFFESQAVFMNADILSISFQVAQQIALFNVVIQSMPRVPRHVPVKRSSIN